jgi:hypothetical protein
VTLNLKPTKISKKKDASFSKKHNQFLTICNSQASKQFKKTGGKTVPRPPTPPKPREPEQEDAETQTDAVEFSNEPTVCRFPRSKFKRGHLIGTKEEVWTGLRYKTSGGLRYEDLIKNKSGKIVSKLQSVRGSTLGIKNLVPAIPKKEKESVQP